MSAGFVLLCFIVLVVVVFLGVVVVGSLTGDGPQNRAKINEARQMAKEAREREAIATNTLRSILNGAGNPVLEAQIALDEINQTYTKELN